jgi:hypothetical protein
MTLRDGEREWTGEGWRLTTVPGEDPQLLCGEDLLIVDDQDARELAECLLACGEDGALRVFESCADGPQKGALGIPQEDRHAGAWARDEYLVFVSSQGEQLIVEAQAAPKPLSVARTQAYSLSVALLEAADHCTAGPCPLCGHSLADEHPVNGCPD